MCNQKYILVIILLISFTSCRKNINHDKLVQIDDLIYHSEKKTLYSGDFYQNNKKGKTIIKGSYDKGVPNSIWNFYNMNGEKIGIVDNDKYDKEFIIYSNNYNDFLLGEWIPIYETFMGNDTNFYKKENSQLIFLENKLMIKKKGEVYLDTDRYLSLDSLSDWVSYSIDFKNDSIRYYNQNFHNVEFKDHRESLEITPLEFTCKMNIIDYFTVIENCKTKTLSQFSYKYIRK